jgi:hypothetical protein
VIREDPYYSYWIYSFRAGSSEIQVRRYDDESKRANFMRFRHGTGPWQMYSTIPYKDTLFRAAVRHLLQEEQVATVTILLADPIGDYIPFDLARRRYAWVHLFRARARSLWFGALRVVGIALGRLC